MSRKCAPIRVVVYLPKTEEGKQELAQRVAGVHADYVCQKLQKLQCASEQKKQLMDAVLQSAKSAAEHQTAVQ